MVHRQRQAGAAPLHRPAMGKEGQGEAVGAARHADGEPGPRLEPAEPRHTGGEFLVRNRRVWRQPVQFRRLRSVSARRFTLAEASGNF